MARKSPQARPQVVPARAQPQPGSQPAPASTPSQAAEAGGPLGLPDRWAGARWSSAQASPAVRYAGALAEGPPPGGAPTLAQHLPEYTLMSSTRPQDI